MLALGNVLVHDFLDEVGPADYGECPVLILADRDQDVFLGEQVSLLRPPLHTLVAMGDRVAILEGCAAVSGKGHRVLILW